MAPDDRDAANRSETADGSNYRVTDELSPAVADGSNYRDDRWSDDVVADGSNYRVSDDDGSETADGSNYQDEPETSPRSDSARVDRPSRPGKPLERPADEELSGGDRERDRYPGGR
jgi:hypothetical protein